MKLAKLSFFLLLSLLSAKSALYAQCISGNCQNGTGVFLYPGGDKYEGDFVNKKKEGKGKLTTKKGESYNGSWKGDRKKWGNFPQAYSHVGQVNAAYRIATKLDEPNFL